jgi:hypothetical protein
MLASAGADATGSWDGPAGTMGFLKEDGEFDGTDDA